MAVPSSTRCGWRRKKGSQDGWTQVAESTRPTKGECYEELMRLSELVGMAPVVDLGFAEDDQPIAAAAPKVVVEKHIAIVPGITLVA